MYNSYEFSAHRILSVKKESELDYTFRVEFLKTVKEGQFFEISIPGVGEAPISVCNFSDFWIEMTIRKVGKLTGELFKLGRGEYIYLRGPYGNGFDLDRLKHKELVFITGGTGLAPVRKVIDFFVQNLNFCKSIELLAGFKTPENCLFLEDLDKWSKKVNVFITVDNSSGFWDGYQGLVTEHLDKLELSNAKEKIAIIVGPPMMMKYTSLELVKRGFLYENILVSFERKMSCGIGKCGHCKIDDTYICIEGPVFNYAKAKDLID